MPNVVPTKGLHFLLRAIPIILREAEANFVIIGSGHWRSYYEDMAQNLVISDNVTFLGKVRVKETPSFYRTCDVHVLLGVNEDFPNAVLEADGVENQLLLAMSVVYPK